MQRERSVSSFLTEPLLAPDKIAGSDVTTQGLGVEGGSFGELGEVQEYPVLERFQDTRGEVFNRNRR